MLIGTDQEVVYPVKKPKVNYTKVAKQLKEYSEWFDSMTREEKDGIIGLWVRDRIVWFSLVISLHFELNN